RWRGNQISAAICGLIPETLARSYLVFPIGEDGETLRLAAVNHNDVGVADKISFMLARPVRLLGASREGIPALFRALYGEESGAHAVDSLQQTVSGPSDLRLSNVRDSRSGSLAFQSPEQLPSELFSRRGSFSRGASGQGSRSGLDTTSPMGDSGVWFYI